jgi:hypothetical protein
MMSNTKRILTSDEALRKAFGRNPLLDALGAFTDVKSMPSKLSNQPLKELPWKDVIVSQRTDFLGMMQSHFVPTPDAVQIALSIQQMIRASYIERNPGLACNRQRRMAIAQFDLKALRTASWFPNFARAMVVSGMTGLGKSLTTRRALELYPKVYPHSPSSEGGWEEQVQLIYLDVSMSSDSSRLGFLDNILLAIDTAVGSKYYEMYGGPKSRMSTEKLMVKIGQILSQLYCGILVIDEIQARNFSIDRELILLFFLRLLNFGIPLLLIGNPNGFIGFEESAQDTRRLYQDGPFDLWPATSGTDTAWKIYVKGKLQFALLPLSFPVDDVAFEEFYRCSGGVPGYFDPLWSAIQEWHLRKGSASISFDAIDRAYKSRKMDKYRRTIEGLVMRDLHKLAVTKDIPLVQFSERWKMTLPPNLHSDSGVHETSTNSTKVTSGKKGSKKLAKPRALRATQADAMYRDRQERAVKAQQAAVEPTIPTKHAARAKANRSTLVTGAEKLASLTSAKQTDPPATGR